MKREFSEKQPEIARLYKVFGAYQSRAQTMEACPCCVKKSEIAALFAVPLADLDAQMLSRYSFKAMTTWGDEGDFKHFLPRLLELSFDGESAFDFGLDWIGNKFSLDENGWKSWPDEEIAALHEFFRAAILKSVAECDWFVAGEWWYQLARIEIEGEAILENWLKNARAEEILALDAWRNDWDNRESGLAQWSRRAEIEELLLFSLLGSDSDAIEVSEKR